MIDFVGFVLIDSVHVIRVRLGGILALAKPAIVARAKLCSKLQCNNINIINSQEGQRTRYISLINTIHQG
jgi:hypothetical protein